MDKPLPRLTKKKKKRVKTPITKIKNSMEDITTDIIQTKRI